jgi:hypothetical protein
MSTLTVTNIKATGETASRAVSGVAAAWVYFSTSVSTSIYSSFNVSSLTDNGTGNTDVNISNAMISNTDICLQGFSNNFQTHNSQPPTASSFNVYTSNASGTAGDGSRNHFLLHGDLA